MSPFRIPGFRRLVTGWSFSNFGDSVLFLTLAIWAKDLTGSDAAAGLVFLFLGIPVFLAPLAGQLADRFSRRRIIVVTNLVAGVMVLALWFVEGPDQLWLIYAVTFMYGLLTYTTSAAGSGLIKDLLDDAQLAAGNGILNTIDQGLRLLSPLVGAGAYILFGGFAISVVTAVMLVTAAIVFATLQIDETPPEVAEGEQFWQELSAGVRHIAAEPVLARMTLALGVAFAMTGLANTTIFAVIEQGLERGAEFFGVLAAIQGGGSIIGGVTAAALIHRLGERSVVAIALVALGSALAVAIVPNIAVVIACVIVVGISIPWFVVGFATLRQRLTPARLQGRVSAATNVALNGPQTVGTAMGAALIGLIDYRTLMVAMGVSVALCAIPLTAFGATGRLRRGTV
jgi:MFS family permease